MGSFKISDEEFECLRGERAVAWVVYLGIRRYMDFETGISGEKRKLSERYFIELTEVEKVRGRKSESLTRHSLRRILERLQKRGLIEPVGELVFRCVLAQSDESVSGNMTQNRRTPRRLSRLNKNEDKQLINMGKDKVRDAEDDAPSFLTTTPPPESGYIPLDSNIDIHTSLPLDTLSKIQKSKFSTLALEVLNYLREKTGRNFGRDEIHTKLIMARLRDREAPTVDDCKLVIDSKWEEWRDSADMSKTIPQLPTTLFRPSNFYRYLDAAKEGGVKVKSRSDQVWEEYLRNQEEREARETKNSNMD
jgi:uncharacterized phage protein (TIGR02220 family)